MFLGQEVSDAILRPICAEASATTDIEDPQTFLDCLNNAVFGASESRLQLIIPFERALSSGNGEMVQAYPIIVRSVPLDSRSQTNYGCW